MAVGVKTLVLNGWAAGYETWELCSVPHDWLFSYVEELDALPERVLADTEAAVLVGFSMGGACALKLLLDFPGRIRGLVLVSATPRMTADLSTRWPGMSDRRTLALARGTEILFADDPAEIYDRTAMARGLEFLRHTDLRAGLEARSASGAFDRLPVAIVQSERDYIVHPDHARFLQRIFPASTLAWVPGAEHVLPVTVPEKVEAAYAEVCRRIRESEVG